MASRCNYKDIQQKDTQFRFSNLPVWNMHDNVLLNKDLQRSKRLWYLTFAQTIGYFSMLGLIHHLSFLFLNLFPFFISGNWLDYLPSPHRLHQMKEVSRHKLCRWFITSDFIVICILSDTMWRRRTNEKWGIGRCNYDFISFGSCKSKRYGKSSLHKVFTVQLISLCCKSVT